MTHSRVYDIYVRNKLEGFVEVAIDLGFRVLRNSQFLKVPAELSLQLKEDATFTVRVTQSPLDGFANIVEVGTYLAPNRYIYDISYVQKVVDGDTLDAYLDLGFDVIAHQRLRLAYIDSYEIQGDEKPMGEKAKLFVESLLSQSSHLWVKSLGQDKYGRWLVELYADDIYVNRELVESGYCKSYDASKFLLN